MQKNQAFIETVQEEVSKEVLSRRIAMLERLNIELKRRLEQKNGVLIAKSRENLSQKKTIIVQIMKIEKLIYTALYTAIILFFAGLFMGVNS